MKVLTLTFQYANNMGAQLQCYALTKYLREVEKTDCQVINYHPSDTNTNWSIFTKPRTFRDFLKLVYSCFNLKILLSAIRKRSLMLNFIKENIPLTEIYNRNKICTDPPQADAYIVGSDQVWNFKIRCDLTYFFDFVKKGKAKIIAYSPSIADPWTEEQISYIAPYIKRFDSLSVREIDNLAQIKKISPSNNPIVVCDPVFLLDRITWDSVIDKKKCPSEPYIFCYFLSVNSMAVQTVEKIRKITGLKVVHFNLNALDKFNSDYNIRVGNPFDFIGLISQAKYVCTNSFHCSAFSIIYRRNFTFVPKNMANERIQNLIKTFGLSDVFISKEKLKLLTIDDLQVNYKMVDEKSDMFFNMSKQYLHNALWK